MPMERCGDRELGWGECAEVLEQAGWCRLAMAERGQPYLVPMAYAVEWPGGETAVFRLRSPRWGLKMQCLEQNRRVALEAERPGPGWVDSVVAFGFARFAPPQPGRAWGDIKVETFQLTGRRHFMAPPGEG